jgi:hypothetical protein
LTTKVHALVDALGNPCNLMLTPGQDHDLTCAQPLLDNADPGAFIGDKADDADELIDALDRRAITPVIPPKANRKVKRAVVTSRSTPSAISSSGSSTKSSITELPPRATTNSLEISSPPSSWSRLSSCSTEDRP